jgi:RimJ/RimL family protein N-acetyltransferase
VGQEDGKFLGAISLMFPEDRPPAAGYWVARWGRNRGAATAALTVITSWGFETLGIESITLATMLGNEASERVAQKAGYHLIGERSDYRPPSNPESVYAVKEWERRRPSGPGHR